jgi:Spy/CpxP family protein refolding chaperone
MNSVLKWKLAFALLLVFVAGVVTGGFLTALHVHRFILGPPHSGVLAGQMREHLRRELQLTPDQMAKIAPVIDSTTAKLEAIRVETAERVRNAMDESASAINPQLTPEQQKKMAALREEHRHRLMHHGFPPPGAPPGP